MANYKAKGRPRLQKNKDAVHFGFTLPESLAKRFNSELHRIQMPKSEIIRQLIESWLSRRGK